MNALYFMHREFPGHSFAVNEMLENVKFAQQLPFGDSWYFLRYCFFGRDCLCSEVSSAVRTHLYNLAATFYRHFEEITGHDENRHQQIMSIITEILDVAEYSREFPVSLWTYGDDTSRAYLAEWMAPMPSPQQMEYVLNLPHTTRHEKERLPYRYDADKTALKRYRNELADYNRRKKMAAKNTQRSQSTLVQ